MRRIAWTWFVALPLFLSSCINALTGPSTGAALGVVNNTGQAIVLRFGDWASRSGQEPATSQIAPGSTLSYRVVDLGKNLNIWYQYTDTAQTKWSVILVESDTLHTTYEFNFAAGETYRLVLGTSTFEYYKGATLLYGAGTTPAPGAAPTVDSTTPANGATGVAASSAPITAHFSTLLDPSTVSSSTFTLKTQSGTTVAGSVSASQYSATFTPAASLAPSATYTATITTGVTSDLGIPLAANYAWSFTTASPVAAPTVSYTNPPSGATAIGVTWSHITAYFTQPLDPATVSTTALTVTGEDGTAVGGSVALSSTNAGLEFTPNAELDYSTVYTARLSATIKSAAGIGLAADYAWSFTTADPQAPTIGATDPSNGYVNSNYPSWEVITVSLAGGAMARSFGIRPMERLLHRAPCSIHRRSPCSPRRPSKPRPS